jgi:hypothetical protein
MSDDEIFLFENYWNDLYTSGIEKIFRMATQNSKETIDLNLYSRLYGIVFQMSSSKSSSIIKIFYQRLLETIKKFCLKMNETSNQTFEEFVKCWKSYDEVVIKWFTKIFAYFTRSINKIKRHVHFIRDLKLIFKEHLYDKYSEEFNKNFFLQLNDCRKNDIIESNILQGYIRFLENMEISYMQSLYDQNFENEIWEHTQSYYQAEITRHLNIPFIDYLKWGMKIISKEFDRFATFLPQNSVVNIINNLRERMFYAHSKYLIESKYGLKHLLNEKDFDSLNKAYNVFGSDNKISAPLFQSNFKSFIKEEFSRIIKKNESIEANGPQEIVSKTNYIEEFIDFYQTFQKVITLCFEGCNILNVSFKEAIENSQNGNFNNSYIFPFYLDKKLRDTNIDKDDFLEKIISIFPSLPDKDVFIDIHKNLLSDRILTKTAAHMDIEEALIGKIKILCGEEFTAILEGVLNDYYLSKEINEKYSKGDTIETNVLVFLNLAYDFK